MLLKVYFKNILDTGFFRFLRYFIALSLLLTFFQVFSVSDYLFFILILVFLFVLNLSYKPINEFLVNTIIFFRDSFKNKKRFFARIKRYGRDSNRIMYIQLGYLLNSFLTLSFNKFRARMHILDLRPQFFYYYFNKFVNLLVYNSYISIYANSFNQVVEKKKINSLNQKI